MRAIQAAPDARTRIAIYAAAMRQIAGRLAPSSASSSRPPRPSRNSPTCGARSPSAGRRTCAASSTDLAAVGTLRVEPGEAADIVWATNAPELYQLLAGQRGWTPERYEHFLADTWQRLLLAD